MTDAPWPDAGSELAQLYGRSFADVYDDWYRDVTDAEATARFVYDRCGTGPVLELGVGTGRLARPLAARGAEVVGLDASADMLVGCVAAVAGDGSADGQPIRIQVVQGDMTALPFRTRFGAVLLGFNTLFNLPSAERQRRLFTELHPCCADDAVVVIETLVTEGLASGPRRSVAVSRRHDDGITVVGTNLDAEQQTILGQHLDIRAGGLHRRPWYLRWAAPDEVDGFAAAAGFTLSEEYGGWDSRPFDGRSDSRIAVYRPGPT